MANQTKRGRRAELATRRSRTDASNASVERAGAHPETAPTVPTAVTSGADFTHAALGQADLAEYESQPCLVQSRQSCRRKSCQGQFKRRQPTLRDRVGCRPRSSRYVPRGSSAGVLRSRQSQRQQFARRRARPRLSLPRQSCQSQSQRREFALRDLGNGDARGCRSVGRRSQPCSNSIEQISAAPI